MFNTSAFMTPFFSSPGSVLPGKSTDPGAFSSASTRGAESHPFAGLLAGMTPGAAQGRESQTGSSLSTTSETLVPGAGIRTGSHLRTASAILESAFQDQGVSADSLVLSQEDLDFLGNVLEGLGLDRSRVDDFLGKVKASRADDLLTLGHFLEDLSAFEQEEVDGTGLSGVAATEILDKSAIPHLELMLRDLGLSPDKVNDLLAASSSKNGAIDIQKLVFQLKSQMNSKTFQQGQALTPDQATVQMGHLDGKAIHVTQEANQAGFLSAEQNKGTMAGDGKTGSGSTTSGINTPSGEPPTIQRVASGLEKLGLSMPDKASNQPFTLEMLVQALEKKAQAPVLNAGNLAMDAARTAETLQEMPALKAMEMEKANTYFGFAREMMIEGQNKPGADKSAAQLFGIKDPLAVDTGDTALRNQGTPMGESRIPAEEIPVKGAFYQADYSRRAAQMDDLKPETQNTATTSKSGIDSRLVSADFIKTEGGPRQEPLQTLVTGGERIQGQTMTFTAAAQEAAMPGKPASVPQQGPLPSAVMDQVGKEIASFLQRGERVFTLQLKPPELGMVNIEMDVKENVLKMIVVAETSSAKDMLQANYVDLRRTLEGFGVRVESFDVQMSQNQNHASTNGDGALNQQSDSHGRSGKNMLSGGQGGESAGEEDIESLVMQQPDKNGLLDLLA